MFGTAGTSELSGRKTLIFSASVVVALLALQPFAWWFLGKSAHTFQDKRSQKEQTTEIERRISVLRTSLQGQEDSLSELSAIAPLNQSLTGLITILEQEADRYRISISITSVKSQQQPAASVAPDNTQVTAVPISLEAVGGIDALFNYIDSLEHMPQLLTVTKWSVVADEAPAPSVAPGAPANEQLYKMAVDVIFYVRGSVNVVGFSAQ